MKRYLLSALAIGFTLGAIFFSASGVEAQVSGSLWKISGNVLYPIITSWGVADSALPNQPCVGTSANGTFQSGTCGGGSGTISTSSPLLSGQSVYATGVNTIASVATSSLTAGSGITFTGTPGYLIGGTNLTISATGGSSYPFPLTGNATSTLTQFNGGLTAYASSTISTLHLVNPLETISGGTGLSSYTIGDTLYASAANTLSALPGNTTTAPLYLTMTGDGVNAAAPSWQAIPIAGSKLYYNYATQATSSPAYFNANSIASTTQTTIPYSLINSSNQIVQNWITPIGDPGITNIPGGTYIADVYAARTSGSSITLSFQIVEVSSTGADIAVIGTSGPTTNLTSSYLQYHMQFNTSVHTMSSTGSRLVMRLLATSNSAATLSLQVGDGSAANFITPGQTIDVSKFVPYTGATQNLNLGSYNASTTQLTVSGSTWIGSLSGVLKATSGLVSTATNGTDYTLLTAKTCTNQVITALTAAGGSTCSTVSNAMLANSTISGVALGSNLNSLSVSGSLTGTSYNGSAAVSNWALNMANANTWTALQQFNGNATTSQFTVSGNIYLPLTGLLKGNGAGNALTVAISGTDYQAPLGINQGSYVDGDMCTYTAFQGKLNCNTTVPTGTVTSVGLSDSNSTLTIGSSPVTTSGTITATLNLAHANTWTALQQFGNASTTQLSSGTNTFYINSAGKVTATDTTTLDTGVLSPTHIAQFTFATSTVWTGTSTQLSPYGDAGAFMQYAPFSGTTKTMACGSPTGTGLTVELTDGSNHAYLIASSTVNQNTFVLSFTKGDYLYFQAGNPTSSPTTTPCTMTFTES